MTSVFGQCTFGCFLGSSWSDSLYKLWSTAFVCWIVWEKLLEIGDLLVEAQMLLSKCQLFATFSNEARLSMGSVGILFFWDFFAMLSKFRPDPGTDGRRGERGGVKAEDCSHLRQVFRITNVKGMFRKPLLMKAFGWLHVLVVLAHWIGNPVGPMRAEYRCASSMIKQWEKSKQEADTVTLWMTKARQIGR